MAHPMIYTLERQHKLLYGMNTFAALQKSLETGKITLNEEAKKTVKIAVDMHLRPKDKNVRQKVISGCFSGVNVNSRAFTMAKSFKYVIDKDPKTITYLRKLPAFVDGEDMASVKDELSEFFKKLKDYCHSEWR